MSSALPLLPSSAVDIFGEWPDLQRPYSLDLQQFLDALGISPLAPAPIVEVARRAHAMPYPPHWSEQLDLASGALYFYHELQDESSWQHPLSETFREVFAMVGLFEAEQTPLDVLASQIEAALAEAQEKATQALAEWVGPIPAGDGTDGAYFYNRTTGQSDWEDPRDCWKFKLHVRYDLLVGFLVAEEKRAAKRTQPQGLRTPDLTPTLTSLASSMSSVASALAVAVAEPGQGEESEGEAYWARPRPRRASGSLPLPPRSTASRGGGREAERALFSMPPHQQRYTADVLQQQEYIPRVERGRSCSQSGGAFPGLIQQPPPPPPGAPPRAGSRP